jgi:hypothetical protein
VINYNLGKDLVRGYVEAGGAEGGTRWERFEKLLTEPWLPSDLVGAD